MCGWLHYVCAPRRTETTVSCRKEDFGVSWPGSILSSSPSRMQRKPAWELSPGTCISEYHMWASAGCCLVRLVQPLSPLPHPCALSVGEPQPCTPGMLPSPAPADRHDYARPPACPPLPGDGAPAPGRAAARPPFAMAQEPAGQSRKGDLVTERCEPGPHLWLARGVVGTGTGTLRHVAGRQVATGAGSSSASPAHPLGTSYPYLGGKGGFAEPQGCGHTPSLGRAPMGALRQCSGRQPLGRCLSQPRVLSGQQPLGCGLSAAAGWQPPPAAPGPWGAVMG